MSNGEPSDPSKTVDMLADKLLEVSTRIVESKDDPEIDLNTAIYLAECAYFLDKKIRETGQLPKRWWTGIDVRKIARELAADGALLAQSERTGLARVRALNEYAKVALTGILACGGPIATPEAIARGAFNMAEAMLAEESKRAKEGR